MLKVLQLTSHKLNSEVRCHNMDDLRPEIYIDIAGLSEHSMQALR